MHEIVAMRCFLITLMTYFAVEASQNPKTKDMLAMQLECFNMI